MISPKFGMINVNIMLVNAYQMLDYYDILNILWMKNLNAPSDFNLSSKVGHMLSHKN